MSTAKVRELDVVQVELPDNQVIKQVAQAQIRYLEILKAHNALELAMRGALPEPVARAARILAHTEFPTLPWDDAKACFLITEYQEDLVNAEIDAYLEHQRLEKCMFLMAPVILFPRQFHKGETYRIKAGSLAGRQFTIQGTDEEVLGCRWLVYEMHPACEAFLFRAQLDQLPMERESGKVYYGFIDKKATLAHECELGEKVVDRHG